MMLLFPSAFVYSAHPCKLRDSGKMCEGWLIWDLVDSFDVEKGVLVRMNEYVNEWLWMFWFGSLQRICRTASSQNLESFWDFIFALNAVFTLNLQDHKQLSQKCLKYLGIIMYFGHYILVYGIFEYHANSLVYEFGSMVGYIYTRRNNISLISQSVLNHHSLLLQRESLIYRMSHLDIFIFSPPYTHKIKKYIVFLFCFPIAWLFWIFNKIVSQNELYYSCLHLSSWMTFDPLACYIVFWMLSLTQEMLYFKE